ncbi:hypothetical protein [Chitinophaga agri]|uniref:Uncharacterized protein n=1 Tax=Chitinophaga agri TaxID=2703787 RepID=A0A6B9Z991_9BACT|nr:hypothetical protein [Chitinophaga agri]QHS58607.1 hypothetical protein GWR21_03040 [Chitinophaga agri]
MILKVNGAVAQDCTIFIDSSEVRSSYFNTDYIDKQDDFSITLATISGSQYSFFKLFRNKENYYVEYGIKGQPTSLYKVDSVMPILDTCQINNLDYYILSRKLVFHYYDMMIIRRGSQYLQIIPTGSTIFDNRECIIECDKTIGFLFLEFEKVYKAHLGRKKKKSNEIAD